MSDSNNSNSPENPNIPTFQRTQSLGQVSSLITHFNALPSFQRRTVESARQLQENISSVIRPLVETTAGVQNAIDLRNYLNRPRSDQTASRATTTHSNEGSFVINFNDDQGTEHLHVDNNHAVVNSQASVAANILNNLPNNNSDNSNNNERVTEFQQFLVVLGRIIPFISILLAKAVYDYHHRILIIIMFLTTFAHSNSVIIREATKRNRRNILHLARELFYIGACLGFTYYAFKEELQNANIMLHLVFMSTIQHPLTIGYLLWILTVTDFYLKLLTVTVKILLTMLPSIVIQFQRRGKFYLFIEAMSQLYRSTATIQPWLYYFLESYQGPEKIFAVFLSAFYMISKGSDLMSRVRLFRFAFLKLLQNVSVGSSPSKEEIQTAGEQCAICHDEYETPVLLNCRHIFCEGCVTTWFDREQTCPLCRTKIVDDPSWRDGSTTYFLQIF